MHAVRIDRICSLMALENEEMSLAVCNLLQAIIDSLSGEDKREHRGKEEALVLGRRYLLFWFMWTPRRSQSPLYTGNSGVHRKPGLMCAGVIKMKAA